MKQNYLVKIFTGNNGAELQALLNDWIMSGMYEAMDEPIYYLNIAYIHYKPKVGVVAAKIYKWELGEKSGAAVGLTAEEVKHILDIQGIRNASITPVFDIWLQDGTPRVL